MGNVCLHCNAMTRCIHISITFSSYYGVLGEVCFRCVCYCCWSGQYWICGHTQLLCTSWASPCTWTLRIQVGPREQPYLIKLTNQMEKILQTDLIAVCDKWCKINVTLANNSAHERDTETISDLNRAGRHIKLEQADLFVFPVMEE